MHRPLLSVVIPTHNRAKYAKDCIRSLLSLEFDDRTMEVVVHDTSTNDELDAWLREDERSDGRLRYVHCYEPLDLTQNHNRALSMATGRYICLIGDDDTILPGLISVAHFAEAFELDCVAPRVVANYAWPDFLSRTFGSAHAGRLYMAEQYGSAIKRFAAPALEASLQRAAQGTDGLPKLYHGLVKMEVLQGIRDKTGAFVHGASPDVSAAVAIAASIESFLELDFPVTLPGASGGSNTGASAMGQHKGNLATTRQTMRYASAWPALIPGFYSVETVWAHAAYETLRLLEHPALEGFCYPALYAQCLLRHRGEVEHTRSSMAHYSGLHSRDHFSTLLQTITEAAKTTSREALRLAVRALKPTAAGGRRYVGGISTVAEAQEEAIRIIQEDQFDLVSILRQGV
ncbi:MAG: glycosyltransferase family 2 protein [Rhizobium rhizophilum]|uniref:glycosyltransferase family 2 protein n=1 Tax=Rhizobium rhizophilum TaxID=1850373 RepID=UPI00391CC6AE